MKLHQYLPLEWYAMAEAMPWLLCLVFVHDVVVVTATVHWVRGRTIPSVVDP